MKKLLAAVAAAGITALTLAPSNATAQESDQQNRIRIDIGQVTPEPITSGQPDSITVNGRLTNVGDRRVSKAEIRLERGDKLDENGLRAALAKPQTGVKFSDFQPAAPSIAPGQTVTFTIVVTLHGASANSLEIDSPGVYPLMVNVNGVPDFGGLAKVGQATTVLPVLSLPGGEAHGQAADAGQGQRAVAAVRPAPPGHRRHRRQVPCSPTTTWPSNWPRAVGWTACSAAYEQASFGLTQAICLAIDPDLVTTCRRWPPAISVQARAGRSPARGRPPRTPGWTASSSMCPAAACSRCPGPTPT